MKTNIHPEIESKFIVYTNGATFLTSRRNPGSLVFAESGDPKKIARSDGQRPNSSMLCFLSAGETGNVNTQTKELYNTFISSTPANRTLWAKQKVLKLLTQKTNYVIESFCESDSAIQNETNTMHPTWVMQKKIRVVLNDDIISNPVWSGDRQNRRNKHIRGGEENESALFKFKKRYSSF